MDKAFSEGANALGDYRKSGGYDFYCPAVPGAANVPNFMKESCLMRQKDRTQQKCFGGCSAISKGKRKERTPIPENKKDKEEFFDRLRGLLKSGLLQKDIAVELGISISSVRRYTRKLL